MKLARKNGSASNMLRVKILDSTSTTGAGLTGLSSASSGLIISTIANNEATATAYTVAGSTIETITTLGTFAAPTATKCRFKEVDSTNHKGVYELQLADARYAVASARSLIVSILGATNAAQVDLEIDLDAQVGVELWRGSQPNALTSGRVEVLLGAVTSGVIAAASFAANALDAVWSTAARVLTAGTNIVLPANAITAASFAAGAIDATAIANNAIDRATFAADTGLQSIRSGTAQAGAASTITLDAGASAVDNFYPVGTGVFLTGGTGAGQFRSSTGYVGATKVMTVDSAWATNPDSTTTFALFPGTASTSDIAAAVWASVARTLTAATNITSTGGTTVPQTGDTFARIGAPVGASIAADVATRATPAQVNTEVLDVLTVDTFAEPGQENPAATTTLVKKIGYLYKFLRNRVTQTSSTLSVYADDATTVDQKATVSDNGTTYDRTEIGTGP